MEEKLNIQVTPAQGDAVNSAMAYGYTTILTGKALEPHDLEAVKFSGILSAPADYLERKKSNWDNTKCHVRADYVRGVLSFHTTENEFNGDVITGKLTESTALAKFKINTGEYWSNLTLAALFRQNRYWFANLEDNLRIIGELNKFTATVQTKIQSHQNNNGASLQSLEKEINGISWNRTFRLNVPLFEGYERVEVPVEIGLVAAGSSVSLFLESPELYELIEQQKGGLLQAQIDRFDAWGCSVVRLT